MPNTFSNADRNNHLADSYLFENFDFRQLDAVLIAKHSPEPADTTVPGYFDLLPEPIMVNFATFSHPGSPIPFPIVSVRCSATTLMLSCDCTAPKKKLCEHQTRVLYNILYRPEIRIFFDPEIRATQMKTAAMAYGLENEANLEEFFKLEYINKKTDIIPLINNLIPVTAEKNAALREILLPSVPNRLFGKSDEFKEKILILKQHRYYSHFQVELLEAAITAKGKPKSPFLSVDALDLLWKADKVAELKFYTAVTKFQQSYESETAALEIEGLKAIVKNPLQLRMFYHEPSVSQNVTSTSVKPVLLSHSPIDLTLAVSLKNGFYTISAEVIIANHSYNLNLLNIKFKYFVFYNDTMYLIDDADFLKVIEYFRANNNHLVIHESKFDVFRDDILSKLEHRIQINYSYLKPATEEQLQEADFDHSMEKIIYLSDSEDYILITPVMRYGKVEVPVLSRKQIFATDQSGNVFSVGRHKEEELQFVTNLTRQHPHFSEQLHSESFYLHRKRFLDEAWFITAFAEWQELDITVLGFNQLKGNRINPHKAKINIVVNSGLNWFDTSFEIKFGSQKVSLKHLHRSIRNKDKFVKLGDGTLGLLPEEWIEKFNTFFDAGEVVEDSLRTPKSNFSGIAELYDQEVLSKGVKMELANYRAKLKSFRSIAHTDVPEGLQTDLRDYQKEGLNWLNFLDDFGFGGCLADDMGLGKTVQIIAFILSQRKKTHHNTNLIVVPTTLIFNWQSEIAKFAPDIKVLTVYGADRIKDSQTFDEYEVVLTSYGTLLYDIGWLKKYFFNYIFLDEAQAIKNPDSLRHGAVRLLTSRNKVTLTGTPIENNTFDLYGQLAFACPGLLGTKRFFRDHYAIPIDKFKDSRRATSLRRKVNPFLLRRTKREVALELPDKTEMVLYCEMGAEQKTAYDACRNEYVNFLMGKKDADLPKHTVHILKGLTQLRQICNSPSLLGDNLVHGVSSSKINTLIEEIENHSPQHKILVFSQFVSMLDLIRTALSERDIAFEYLTGQTRNREQKVSNFRDNENVRVFLISLKAGGTGLNLTEADYVYLVDPWWNPAAENQAIDRCYRIGQKKNVVAVRLICPDTIEEKIMKLQDVKKELVSDIIQTDGQMIKTLSRADLLSLFS